LALAVFITGCSPPGPRALLKGRKLLARGDYAGAVSEFKTATTLLATNAQAWNYYGVALQQAEEFPEAVTAYQRALALDRDLMEAHYNLGSLWLEQNKFDAAKTEFTAYTLRRNNAPAGWLKLGDAELGAGEIVSAEKSFSTALYLNADNAEALNGLGLARVQRGRPQEAAKFFAAAAQDHPDFAPAILNLATVEEQYLHDNKSALQHYRQYLAFTPRPKNWEAVNAIVSSLERPETVGENSAPKQNPMETPAPKPQKSVENETRTPRTYARPETSSRTQFVSRSNSYPPSRPATTPAQIVRVAPEPAIAAPSNSRGTTAKPFAEPPPESAPEKHGVLHKLNPIHWFESSKPQKSYSESGITPLPSPDEDNDRVTSTPVNPMPAPAISSSAPPVKIVSAAPPTFPNYLYLSPRKPKFGDRVAASGYFTKAREYEQASRWSDAMDQYRRATEADPTWFEAQYNYGVLAYRLRDFGASLAAYEMALAIQPDSVDARYNFALALKAAGYVPDAVSELKKIIAANPDEVRAQLALGNLYAQQLRDSAQAREHYLKVLQLDPRNPQAADIQFWLSAHPR